MSLRKRRSSRLLGSPPVIATKNRDSSILTSYQTTTAGIGLEVVKQDKSGDVYSGGQKQDTGNRVDRQGNQQEDHTAGRVYRVQAQENGSMRGAKGKTTFAAREIHGTCATSQDVAEGLELSGKLGKNIHLYDNGTPGGSR